MLNCCPLNEVTIHTKYLLTVDSRDWCLKNISACIPSMRRPDTICSILCLIVFILNGKSGILLSHSHGNCDYCSCPNLFAIFILLGHRFPTVQYHPQLLPLSYVKF